VDDFGRSMGGDLHLLLDAHLAKGKSMLILLGMLIDPGGCPADEVGGENGQGFLQINGWFGAHFQAVEIENLFSFLDARLDGLASVVLANQARKSSVTAVAPKCAKALCFWVCPV